MAKQEQLTFGGEGKPVPARYLYDEQPRYRCWSCKRDRTHVIVVAIDGRKRNVCQSCYYREYHDQTTVQP